ncbi:uncharacterized protein [Malus domestica]|uniref:uncharacterized protein n=1 Tax=Malus domestica TaxID=3750 RepID=UPI003976A545
MKVLLKALELWNIVEADYEETDNEAVLTQAQMNSLRENQKKDSKTLFHIYQTIEMLAYERVAKAENKNLPVKFDYVVAAIKESNDISTFSMEEVQGKLEAHEIKINLRNPPATQPDQALKSQVTTMGGNGNQALDVEEADEFNRGQVRIGDDKAYKIEGIGEVSFKPKSGTIEKVFEVYYVSGLKSNLLSMGHLLRKGYDIRLHGDFCVIKRKDKFVAKIFGCAAYSHVPKELRNKLDHKVEKCIFIGYNERSKAYKLYNPKTKKFLISYDVHFDENAFFEEENEIAPQSPRATTSDDNSPPRKLRSTQDLYDFSKQVDLKDNTIFFSFFAGEDPVSFNEACEEEKRK